MKKTLVALATLAVAGGAFAQSGFARAIDGSGVTIFGVADATVNRLTATNNGSILRLAGDGRNESTRLGFRGIEDIGGGWGAAFWLEAAYNQDDGTGSNTTINNTAAGDKIAFGTSAAAVAAGTTIGTLNTGVVTVPANQSLTARQGLTFNRAANVSLLNKGFGEIRVGRDYSPTFWNYTYFDPFGTVGVGSALNIIGGGLAPAGSQASPPGNAYPMVRTSNSIGWLSQDMNGFRAQVQYAFSEVPSICTTPETTVNTNYCAGGPGDGRHTALRLSYSSGPLSAAYAHGETAYGNVSAAAGALDGTVATVITSFANNAAGGAQPLGNTAAYKGKYSVDNFGAAYQLGATKLTAQYASQEYGVSGAVKKYNTYHVGVAHTSGAITYKASYNYGKLTAPSGATSADGSDNNQMAFGMVYDLSKRTAVYGTYSILKTTLSSAGASNGVNASMGLTMPLTQALGTSGTLTGLDIGVRHRF